MSYIGNITQISSNSIVINSSPQTQCGSCGKCSRNRHFEIRVKTPPNHTFLIGDRVSIEISEFALILVLFLVYMLPILLLFFAYFLSACATHIEGVKILVAFASCALAFILLRQFEKHILILIHKDIKISKIQ